MLLHLLASAMSCLLHASNKGILQMCIVFSERRSKVISDTLLTSSGKLTLSMTNMTALGGVRPNRSQPQLFSLLDSTPLHYKHTIQPGFYISSTVNCIPQRVLVFGEESISYSLISRDINQFNRFAFLDERA